MFIVEFNLLFNLLKYAVYNTSWVNELSWVGIPNGLVPLLRLSKFYSIKHLVSYLTPYVKCALFSRSTHLGHRVPKRYSKVWIVLNIYLIILHGLKHWNHTKANIVNSHNIIFSHSLFLTWFLLASIRVNLVPLI